MTNPITAAAICSHEPGVQVLQDIYFSGDAQNELLLFIKPEVFLGTMQDQLNRVELILRKLDDFEVSIHGVVAYDGPSLAAQEIMDRHYGYINRLSREASRAINANDRECVYSQIDAKSDALMLGGHEVLAKYPHLNSKSLDDIWATKKSKKLRSGFYFEKYDIEGDEVVVINGFHPLQLDHFTGSDRRIVLLILRSDLPWRWLRGRMLGDTFPEKALRNSIRGEFNESPNAYGFESVTIANNCVHMSAGPFEATFEFQNFLGTQPEFAKKYSFSALIRKAEAMGISQDLLRQRVASGGVLDEQVSLDVSIFDATEEIDTYSSLEILRQAMGIQPRE